MGMFDHYQKWIENSSTVDNKEMTKYNEPDRVDFVAHGFPCILQRNPMGAWCGYVGIPKDHKFYGQDEDLDLDVHGGITYAEECNDHICHDSTEKVWWLGFDCAHAYDHVPKLGFFNGQVYRTMAYAQNETERLAEQLVE